MFVQELHGACAFLPLSVCEFFAAFLMHAFIHSLFTILLSFGFRYYVLLR